jgi:hypothetical protein
MSYLKFTPLTPELYQYCLDISAEESSILHGIHEQNEEHPQIHMQISSDQAQFLQFLIRSKNIKKILEIGTFLGYSAAAMAEALPHDGKLITCDIDAQAVSKAQEHWNNAHLDNKIKCMIAPALDSMQKLFEQKEIFEFIFIDADKRNSIAYYEFAKKLLDKKGIIAVDNIFYHGEVCQSERSKAAQFMHEFNLHVKHDMSVNFSLLPLADGLMLIQKNN